MQGNDKEVDATEEVQYDASNPEHVANRKAASGRRQKMRSETLKALTSSPQGRDFVWDILTMCGIHRSTYNDNALRMAFDEGQRNIGLFIEAQLVKASPQNFKIMLEEHQNG